MHTRTGQRGPTHPGPSPPPAPPEPAQAREGRGEAAGGARGSPWHVRSSVSSL